MPKYKYALERGEEKLLEVSYIGRWKNIIVTFDGDLIGAIPNQKEVRAGKTFQLPDGTDLKVQLVRSELRILRNDKPVPGSSSDPAVKLSSASGLIFLFGGANIVLGIIALVFHNEYLQSLSFGIPTIAMGLFLVVLGFLSQRRSIAALIVSMAFICLNLLLILYSGYNSALARYGFSETRLIGLSIMYLSLPVDFAAAGLSFLISIGRSPGAITELKKESSEKAADSTLSASTTLANNKKSPLITVIVVLTAFLFILVGGLYWIKTNELRNVINLKADGSGDYSTLDAALGHLREGGTINLAAGTYLLTKPLEINKPVKLIGAGMDQTIVTSAIDGYAIRFNGEGAFTLQNLTVQIEGGSTATGVEILRGEIALSGCRFMGNGKNGPGLMVTGNTTGFVTDCEAINNGKTGFDIEGQARLTLEKNKCKNNKEAGIGFYTDAQGTARENQCSGNEIGIFAIENVRVTLEGNKTSDNQTAGMFFGDNSTASVRGNECSRNGEFGVFIADKAEVELEENSCTVNEETGIYAANQAKADLEKNIISDNLGIGIIFSNDSSGNVRLNECSRNMMAGIWIKDQAQVTLEENNCSNNEGNGIVLSGKTKSIARLNICSGNMTNGIFVTMDAEPVIEDNQCSNNEAGIGYQDDAKGTARRNHCSENEDGIIIIGQSQPILEGNITIENSRSGIGYMEMGAGIASQNDCSHNGVGIMVGDQANPELTNNICNDNEVAGISFAGASGGSAVQNECSRNQAGIAVIDQAEPLLEGNISTENEYGLLLGGFAIPVLKDNNLQGNKSYNTRDIRTPK